MRPLHVCAHRADPVVAHFFVAAPALPVARFQISLAPGPCTCRPQGRGRQAKSTRCDAWSLVPRHRGMDRLRLEPRDFLVGYAQLDAPRLAWSATNQSELLK